MMNRSRPSSIRPKRPSPTRSGDTEEHDRPSEWLRALLEGRRSYRWLVDDSRGLAIAAYRVARARCRVQPAGVALPTVTEYYAAARQIEGAIEGRAGFKLPLLLDECERSGLTVIRPLRAA
jgi:hypothetical protein